MLVKNVEKIKIFSKKKKKKKKINHALNQNIINMQSKNTISLAATFGTVKLQFTD